MNKKLHFTIADDPRMLRTHRIYDLCEYLTSKVLEPLFAREGARWDARFMDFFNHDPATDPMEPTGVIRLTVPPLFTGRLSELESAIISELSALGIKTGAVFCAHDPQLSSVRIMSIPVLENPTVLISPPDVNIGYNRGSVVLRDLLGFEPANGRYQFAAEELLKRASAVTEDKIAAATAAPLKTSEGVKRTPSAITMNSLKRCLEEIKSLAAWATKHNYRTLAAG